LSSLRHAVLRSLNKLRIFNPQFLVIQFTSVVTPPTPPRYVLGRQRADHGITLVDA